VTVYVGAAAHQGSRYGFDRWGGRGASNTYLMDGGSQSVFFGGDTGLRPHSHSMVSEILSRANRRLDVALLPIGYSSWWKPGFRRHHLSPADALLLFDRLQARVLVPYHWGTFHHLTSGPFDAVRQLERLLPRYPQRDNVRLVAPGTSVVIDSPTRPINDR
jgi:L-ascorbate metabolism protein UlaG (beta-lactamase superfamily)